MDDKAAKKRSWIKNIAIIFLALMLVLTLFSNTIMNYSLPQISAQYCYSGSITTRIRGSANVEAKSTYELNSPSSATVKDIGVNVGDYVEQGTVMFLFEDETEGDIATAKTELADLKEQYNSLSSSSSSSGSSEYDSVYSQLVEAYTAKALASEAKTKIAELKNEIKQLEKELEPLNEEYESLKADIQSAKEGKKNYSDVELAEAQVKYENACAAYENAKAEESASKANKVSAETSKRNAENEYRTAREAAGDSISDTQTSITEDSMRSSTRNIEDLQRAYNSANEAYLKHYQEYTDNINSLLADVIKAKSNFALLYEDYLNSRSEIDELVTRHDTLTEELNGAPTSERVSEINTELEEIEADESYIKYTELKEKEELYLDAYNVYNDAVSTMPDDLVSEQNALEEQKITLDRALEDYERDLEEYKAASKYSEYINKIEECSAVLEEAERIYSDAASSLESAKAEYESAKAVYDAAVLIENLEAYEAKCDELEAKCDALNEQISEKTNEQSSYESIRDDSRGSDANIRSLQAQLSKIKKETGVTDDSENEVKELRLEVLSAKISEKEDEITRLLEGNYTTEVTAPVSGVISVINVTSGCKVMLNDTIAEITITDSGYTATLNVSIEQAQRLKRGDVAEIQNYWWGETPTAVISSISVDRTNPQNRRNVTLDITGDVSVGTELTFSIGEKAQNYDVVVPNIAIHEDNSGKFVYAIDVKSTPLGARYTTRRVDVNVIASDESQSAVSGLTSGEYVITASSKPLTNSMQIRFSE